MSEKYSVPRVAVNGFGRIGSLLSRVALAQKNIQIVAINAPSLDAEFLTYMLKHDSVHGKLNYTVEIVSPTLIRVDGNDIALLRQRDPTQIDWSAYNVDIVAECTGVYTTTEKCQVHLTQGASKVVISAPAKDKETPFFVYGVNHTDYKSNTTVVSNSSCTTNCLAPLAKLINDTYGIEEGLMTTVHAVTATQAIVDGASKKDFRSSRCATRSIIPASTGAAKALARVIPELAGKVNGMAMRVPVENVSVVDLTVRLNKPIQGGIEEITAAIEAIEADATHPMHGILGATREQVVSCDFNGDNRSCIFDHGASILLNPTFVKLVAYYDNEWGYSCRMADLIAYVHNH